MKTMLESRGISVKGSAHAHHRISADSAGFLTETREPVADIANPVTSWRAHGDLKDLVLLCNGCEGTLPPRPTDPIEKILATHDSPTVAEDVVITNKESQNLHAELLLRQLGAAVGTDGSTAQGARVVRSFLVNAGLDKDDFVFFDGSGLSGHDLVTPRAIAKLLQFAATQPWFATYKASLPIGGVDGSLESRFTKAPLKGHVFAKTGTNSETRALSGYLECASGRTVIFSILAGDHFPSTTADREAMDRIVAAIAAAN
jgi:D-alanyl-D-alanine carboxypeptidase/D-alanyl-D-alanine-endopeptidase (penicillin-binding protein 4)